MDMRKSMDVLFKEDELSFDQFKEKFDDFLFRDEDTVAKQFDEMNEFMMSFFSIIGDDNKFNKEIVAQARTK